MPHANGYRARTRFMFSRAFRQKGVINLSTYLKSVKVGDLVDIVANAAVHKGMPHKFYHGRTGTVFNVTPRAVGVEVNKQVGGGFRSRFRHLAGVRPLPRLPACLRAQARGKMCCL